MSEVDDFVNEKVLPVFHPVVARLRELMKEFAPEATERIGYSLPMWFLRYPVCWISPSKKEIKFSFTVGVELDDPYGLLKGDAKYSRYVRLRRLEDINEEALRSYVSQAAALDPPGPSPYE